MKVNGKPISTYSREQLTALTEARSTPEKVKNKIRNYLQRK